MAQLYLSIGPVSTILRAFYFYIDLHFCINKIYAIKFPVCFLRYFFMDSTIRNRPDTSLDNQVSIFFLWFCFDNFNSDIIFHTS